MEELEIKHIFIMKPKLLMGGGLSCTSGFICIHEEICSVDFKKLITRPVRNVPPGI